MGGQVFSVILLLCKLMENMYEWEIKEILCWYKMEILCLQEKEILV